MEADVSAAASSVMDSGTVLTTQMNRTVSLDPETLSVNLILIFFQREPYMFHHITRLGQMAGNTIIKISHANFSAI